MKNSFIKTDKLKSNHFLLLNIVDIEN